MNLTAYQQMLSGELYNASDPELVALRHKARSFLQVYNQAINNKAVQAAILQQLLGKAGENIHIEPPFFADYGCHISTGKNFYANFNCVFLDCNYINIGDNVMMGPAVQLYAATHPLVAAERIAGPELASPINIGNNVWIGGGSVICPGVTIGDNTTIGAGSVVVKDIPANVLAVGNPCRVVKTI